MNHYLQRMKAAAIKSMPLANYVLFPQLKVFRVVQLKACLRAINRFAKAPYNRIEKKAAQGK